MPNVISTTVKNNLCVGCGVCSALCPQSNILMKWNKFGEYNPVLIKKCQIECELCMHVCPMLTTSKNNEDIIAKDIFGSIREINHCPEVGYYLKCGVGGRSDKNIRAACASGGLASWFLEQLIARNIVDATICVTASSDREKLFAYSIIDSVEKISQSRGSVYYPNELSEVLKYVLTHNMRYALIALPCCVKAIRLAQIKNKILKERIIVIAGLACGRMKSSLYTNYTAYLSGLKEKPSKVVYRNTDLSAPPSPHRYMFYNKCGEKKQISASLGDKIYHSSIMTLTACRFCDDMFAECADIVFMDAWLDEYTKTEPRGTSIFVARSQLASDILYEGMNSTDLAVTDLSISKVIQSQGGLIRRKKIAYMQKLYRRDKLTPPEKRFTTSLDTNLSGLERILARQYASLDTESRSAWLSCNGDYKKFHEWVERIWIRELPLRAILFGEKLIQTIIRKLY